MRAQGNVSNHVAIQTGVCAARSILEEREKGSRHGGKGDNQGTWKARPPQEAENAR